MGNFPGAYSVSLFLHQRITWNLALFSPRFNYSWQILLANWHLCVYWIWWFQYLIACGSSFFNIMHHLILQGEAEEPLSTFKATSANGFYFLPILEHFILNPLLCGLLLIVLINPKGLTLSLYRSCKSILVHVWVFPTFLPVQSCLFAMRFGPV